LFLGCKSVLPADIVFVVDESGSVGQTHFDDTLRAISDTVDNLVIHKDLIHVGMTLFEGHGTSRTMLNLKDGFDKTAVKDVLIKTTYKDGKYTDIADAFNYVCNKMFVTGNGDRSNADNYLVLLTDGKSDINKAVNQAGLCSSNGVKIISVGIGSGVDVNLLTTVAYKPEFYINTDYSELNTTLPQLVTKSIDCSEGINYFVFCLAFYGCKILIHWLCL
jgi:hypothetical protein